MEPEQHRQLVSQALDELGNFAQSRPDGPVTAFHQIALKRDRRLVIRGRIASEGRLDRLQAVLAQAVLEGRTLVRTEANGPSDLVVVVVVPRTSERTALKALSFIKVHAADVAAAIFVRQGERLVFVPDNQLEELSRLNVNPRNSASRLLVSERHVNLFSDRNQWLLKLLLARHLNRHEWLGGPIAQYRNATELAASDAGDVSIMSAFRLLEALRNEGFLHESSSVLQLVRVRELLERWQATYRRPPTELGVKWLLPSRNPNELSNAINRYGERACCGLFAAAHAHGFRHVSGVPIHVYVDNFDADGLRRMGVVPAHEHETPDLILRIPLAKEAVFRAQVPVGRGRRACDILQVWLDVAWHPTRGREQADIIYRHTIEPMLVGGE
ncbi:MAG: hypothetical protein AMXMBFR57_20100 [Acidimicrobiia bacterium]